MSKGGARRTRSRGDRREILASVASAMAAVGRVGAVADPPAAKPVLVEALAGFHQRRLGHVARRRPWRSQDVRRPNPNAGEPGPGGARAIVHFPAWAAAIRLVGLPQRFDDRATRHQAEIRKAVQRRHLATGFPVGSGKRPGVARDVLRSAPTWGLVTLFVPAPVGGRASEAARRIGVQSVQNQA